MNFYSKENTNRWPYTFAYDWIRMAGLAESRADAAQWFKVASSVSGNELERLKFKLIEIAAQEYCNYYNELNRLEKAKEKAFADWSILNPNSENEQENCN